MFCDGESKEKEASFKDNLSEDDEKRLLLEEIKKELESLSPEGLKRLQDLITAHFGPEIDSK